MTSCIWWRWTALLTKAVCTWQLDSRREERAAMLRCKMSSRMVWQRTIVSVRCPNKNSRTAWCCRWPFSSQVIFVVSLAFSCEHSCAQWSIADTLSCHCRLYFGFKTREIRVRQSKIQSNLHQSVSFEKMEKSQAHRLWKIIAKPLSSHGMVHFSNGCYIQLVLPCKASSRFPQDTWKLHRTTASDTTIS